MSFVSVFGIYPSRNSVVQAIELLENAGFSKPDISILFSLESSTLRKSGMQPAKFFLDLIRETDRFEGIAFDHDLVFKKTAIPGSESLLGTGPIISRIVKVKNTTRLANIADALNRLGMPEGKAIRYQDRLNSKWVMLAVHTNYLDFSETACEILRSTGAEEISKTGEMWTTEPLAVARNRLAI